MKRCRQIVPCLTLLFFFGLSMLVVHKPLLATTDAAQLGTEFILSVPPIYEQSGSGNSVVCYVSSPYETTVRFEIPGRGIVKTVVTRPNGIVQVRFAPAEVQPFVKSPNQLAPAAVEYPGTALIVTSDAPIMLYLAARFSFTTDATMILPTSRLGKEYVVGTMADMSAMYPGLNLPSETVICATANNTEVFFTLGGNGITRSTDGMKPGDTREFVLQRGDVLSFNSATAGGDVSGSYIRANKPVSVLSGNQCANVPESIRWCDYIVSSEIPLSSWGHNYHVPSMFERDDPAIIKIFAANDNTTVLRDGLEFDFISNGKGGVVNSGFYYGAADEGAARAITFSANNPISIKFFNRGQEADDVVTDPAAVQLLPVEQYVHYMRFNPPGIAQLNFANNHIVLIHAANAAGEVAEDLEIGLVNNGQFIWQALRDVYGVAAGEEFATIGDGRKWSQKQIALPDPAGVYAIRSASEPFMVYSFGSNNYDSYAMQNASFLRDLSSDDNLAPTNTLDTEDGSVFQGRVLDIAQDGEAILGLASIGILPEGSENFDLNVPLFSSGTTEFVPWTAQVVNPRLPARLRVLIVDRGGNFDTFEFSYEPPLPELEVNPEIVDFGQAYAGIEVIREITISNMSTQDPLLINAISLLDNSLGFEILSTAPALPASLAARKAGSEDHIMRVTIRWTGTGAGLVEDQLLVNANNEPTIALATLRAIALPSNISISGLGAGKVAVGEIETRELTIYNGAALAIIISDFEPPAQSIFSFVDVDADLGGLPFRLEPQSSGEFRLRFAPQAAIEYKDIFKVNYTFEGGQAQQLIVELEGEGVESVSSVAPKIHPATVTDVSLQPNPAASDLTIGFTMLTAQPLSVELYDVRGNQVLALPARMFGAGLQSVELDVSGLAPGAYICRLGAGAALQAKPFVVGR